MKLIFLEKGELRRRRRERKKLNIALFITVKLIKIEKLILLIRKRSLRRLAGENWNLLHGEKSFG